MALKRQKGSREIRIRQKQRSFYPAISIVLAIVIGVDLCTEIIGSWDVGARQGIEQNGIYIGKDGYLMEMPDEPKWRNVEKNIECMIALTEQHSDIPAYMCLVPDSFCIMKDKMSGEKTVRNQMNDLKRVSNLLGDAFQSINIAGILQCHAQEELYYKTDCHWTSLGAYYAFDEIAETMGIRNPESNYNIYTVAEDFQGALALRSGYYESRDTVEVYEPRHANQEYIVSYVEEGEKSTSIYNSSCVEGKDKYDVFLGGDYARIDISTTQKERKNLLLFKDSYANCMIQFLVPYFQNIVIIDPRYYYKSINEIIEFYSITDILFLYNINTFLRDESIADVLAEKKK